MHLTNLVFYKKKTRVHARLINGVTDPNTAARRDRRARLNQKRSMYSFLRSKMGEYYR